MKKSQSTVVDHGSQCRQTKASDVAGIFRDRGFGLEREAKMGKKEEGREKKNRKIEILINYYFYKKINFFIN